MKYKLHLNPAKFVHVPYHLYIDTKLYMNYHVHLYLYQAQV